jgi:hypothetical protein
LPGLSITTLEPFTIALTESILVCLAENGVLLWRYQSATSQNLIPINDASNLSRRRERVFHIDETPNFQSESNLESNLDFNNREPAFQDLLKQVCFLFAKIVANFN